MAEAIAFSSFDGGVKAQAVRERPTHYRDLEAPNTSSTPYAIARGGGFSYAAASFRDGSLVQDMGLFNRIVEFDPHNARIRVEAGITFGDLLSFLVPRGWWLPVCPGYPLITIGGAIAANVHGKSPAADGIFEDWVESLLVFHPSHGFQALSRSDGAPAFWLTVGGLGLTGLIVQASLRIERLPRRQVSVSRRTVQSFEETVELLLGGDGTRFQYSWHDISQKAGSERGFLFGGEFADGGDNNHPGQADWQVRACPRSERLLARRPPVGLMTGTVAAAMNALYRRAVGRKPERHEEDLFSFLFPFSRQHVYFSLFGRKGFCEYQMLVRSEAVHPFLKALRRVLTESGDTIVFASLKRFSGKTRNLTFRGDGIAIAIDFPRNGKSADLLRRLDQVVKETESLPYLIKDSRLPRSVVEATYPEYGKFLSDLMAYDPQRRYRSELSDRLGL